MKLREIADLRKMLITATKFKVVDSVDITNPDVLNTESADIKDVGGRPIFTDAMCNQGWIRAMVGPR